MWLVIDQAIGDGQGLVSAIQTNVNVYTVDHHLAAPPLGAVNQLGVAVFVGDRPQLVS